jgi:hypothetical protein
MINNINALFSEKFNLSTQVLSTSLSTSSRFSPHTLFLRIFHKDSLNSTAICEGMLANLKSPEGAKFLSNLRDPTLQRRRAIENLDAMLVKFSHNEGKREQITRTITEIKAMIHLDQTPLKPQAATKRSAKAVSGQKSTPSPTPPQKMLHPDRILSKPQAESNRPVKAASPSPYQKQQYAQRAFPTVDPSVLHALSNKFKAKT